MRDEASPFFPSGTSSPALASFSFLLRSSMPPLQRFMPIPLPPPSYRDAAPGDPRRWVGLVVTDYCCISSRPRRAFPCTIRLHTSNLFLDCSPPRRTPITTRKPDQKVI